MTDSTTLPSGLAMAGWEHSFIDVDVIEAQWQKIPRSKSGPKVLGEHLWTRLTWSKGARRAPLDHFWF